MKPEDLKKRIAQIKESVPLETALIKATLLLTEVVNDGVLEMRAMYNEFTHLDDDLSDVEPLGDGIDPNVTLDERSQPPMRKP